MDHIEKIKYRTFYNLKESARFKEMKENTFDVIPDDLLEDNGEEEEVVDEPTNQEVPEPPADDDNIVDDSPEELPDDLPADAEPVSPEEPMEDEESVDELQNEIIKLNTVALNSLNQKLDDLKQITISLNDKINDLSYDVEEVREPDTEEKLMDQKNVSFPYYANLNDYWSNNWFEQQKEESKMSDMMDDQKAKGIKAVGDGTYVADFDDLPPQNQLEIKDSFNDFI